MAISLTPPDDDIEKQALDVLDAIGAGLSQPLLDDAEGGGAIVAQLARPIPVYAPRTTARASLESAYQTGWRYLVTDSDMVGAIDVAQSGETSAEVIADTSLAERIGQASSAAAAIVGDDDGDYDLRLLDLNFVGDSVLWLAHADKQDRFFSLSGDHGEIERTEVARRIRRGLGKLARSRASQDAESGG